MGNFFLSQYASALFVVILVGLVTWSFLLVNRDKSRHSRWLTLYMATVVVYNIMQFCATAVFHSTAGYTYFGARIILISMIFFLTFVYGFPRNLHPRESFWVTLFFGLLILAGLFLGVSTGLKSEIIYSFEQLEFHPFIPADIDSFMAIVVLLQYLWIIILCLRKARLLHGRDRRALVAFAGATLIPLLLSIYSAITLSKAFSTEFNTFLFAMGMIISYYTYLISYVNNLRKSASFIFKLVALSLVTTLIFFAGITALRDNEIEESYHEQKILQLERIKYSILSAEPASYPPDMAFFRKKLADGSYRISFLNDQFSKYIDKEPVQTTKGTDRFYHDVSDNHSFIITKNIQIKDDIYEAGYFYSEYRKFLHERYAPMALLTLFAILVISIVYPVFFRIALLNPMEKLLSGVREVNRGHFDVRVIPEFHDEVGYLTRSFNRMISSVKRGIDQKTMNILYERNLEIARQIQRSLMPEKTPDIPGITIAVRYLPADKIGGDFYDFYLAVPNETCVMLADVSGHGVPAATLSGMVKISFQTEAAVNREPGDTIKGMNQRLNGQMGRQFVTVGLAKIDHARKSLVYASGGHPPLLLLNRNTGAIRELFAEGGILGLFIEMEFQTMQERLNPADRIILYSDGLTEILNREDELFGSHRLKNLLREIAHLPANEFADKILEEQKRFANPDSELFRHPDDITLVVLDFEDAFFKH